MTIPKALLQIVSEGKISNLLSLSDCETVR